MHDLTPYSVNVLLYLLIHLEMYCNATRYTMFHRIIDASRTLVRRSNLLNTHLCFSFLILNNNPYYRKTKGTL